MRIPAGEDIGPEVHSHTTQFIRVETGRGVAHISGKRYNLTDGDAIVIPPNTRHNITATSADLHLYTIYSPPEHSRGEKELKKSGVPHP